MERYDVPDSVYFMLDILKKFILKYKKKVLVHCHVDNGRTGIVVDCYLITYYNYNTEKAVAELRILGKNLLKKMLK